MSTTTTEKTQLEVELAKAKFALSRVNLFGTPVGMLGRLLMQAHLVADHKWTVTPDDAANAQALRSMHVEAHRRAVWELEEELMELEEGERWAAKHPEAAAADAEMDAAYTAMMIEQYGPDPYDSPEYREWNETQSHLCHADYVTGPHHDPYGTSCEHGAGHYPHTQHSAPHPLDDSARVSWGGGGTCAGDPLPYTNVRVTP